MSLSVVNTSVSLSVVNTGVSPSVVNTGVSPQVKSAGQRSGRLDEQRRKKSDTEEKLCDKNRVHSFILDLESGTEERQRTKTARKEVHLKDKERKDEHKLKHKLKAESRKAADADEKDGGAAKGGAEEKKGSKVKPDRKSSVTSREAKTPEAADEANLKKGKMAADAKDKEKPKPSGESRERTVFTCSVVFSHGLFLCWSCLNQRFRMYS